VGLLMPLVLRVDVDKPYGRKNVIQKVLSKIKEDYWFPSISALGYLSHVKYFLDFLANNNIRAHIYFRICTLPPNEWLSNTFLSQHLIGHHAEDTRSLETLTIENKIIQSFMLPLEVSSFNKHGSGNLKLGRHHYPVYEPEKYREWAIRLGIPFLFGNEELVKTSTVYSKQNGYYPNMFWIDRTYSESDQLPLEYVVRKAEYENIVVIIHPANFAADELVVNKMKKLILMAKQHNVPWITIESK